MNKNLSLAIEKAVEKISPNDKFPIDSSKADKKPDLFSLTSQTELFQNEKGTTIKIDRSKDAKLTDFGKATLSDRYLGQNESYQDLFARVASIYADDNLHAQRIYNYISNLWFMPATPILSNGGTERGLPISCFLNEAGDSLNEILDLWSENVWLAAKGGGIGSYWGNLRSIGEKIGRVGKTSGIIPFIKVMDSLTMAISQGSLRRGSAACYLPVDHPEIEEFIEMRRPTGGDPNRRSLNLHHGVLVSDAFMRAVETNSEWALKSPKDGIVQSTVPARNLWIRLLTARVETGEPYIIFVDTVNRLIPQHHKLAGLNVKTSNLCSEITLPTGIDKDGHDRTAVCCLSSLNLESLSTCWSVCVIFSSFSFSALWVLVIFIGIFLTLLEGKIAAPLFEISPLYILSKLSSCPISNSSNSIGLLCDFLNLSIAESSNVFIEIFPSPISLSDITVFLSLSS